MLLYFFQVPTAPPLIRVCVVDEGMFCFRHDKSLRHSDGHIVAVTLVKLLAGCCICMVYIFLFC